LFYTFAYNKDTGYLLTIYSLSLSINMDDIASFYSDRPFYGDSYFPYGIDRSGEFTYQQVALLKNHGWAYQGLAEGSREPLTLEEERFVAVCQGIHPPESAHEKVWVLYLKKTSTPPFNFSTSTIKSDTPDEVGEDSVDDDFE
jgi:uncharacterized protein YifE (UPF0438 family)